MRLSGTGALIHRKLCFPFPLNEDLQQHTCTFIRSQTFLSNFCIHFSSSNHPLPSRWIPMQTSMASSSHTNTSNKVSSKIHRLPILSSKDTHSRLILSLPRSKRTKRGTKCARLLIPDAAASPAATSATADLYEFLALDAGCAAGPVTTATASYYALLATDAKCTTTTFAYLAEAGFLVTDEERAATCSAYPARVLVIDERRSAAGSLCTGSIQLVERTGNNHDVNNRNRRQRLSPASRNPRRLKSPSIRQRRFHQAQAHGGRHLSRRFRLLHRPRGISVRRRKPLRRAQRGGSHARVQHMPSTGTRQRRSVLSCSDTSARQWRWQRQ